MRGTSASFMVSAADVAAWAALGIDNDFAWEVKSGVMSARDIELLWSDYTEVD
jgi:hypothetical protein